MMVMILMAVVGVVGQQPKRGGAVAAAGWWWRGGGASRGEWHRGSGRLGDENYIWFWSEISPENFSGGGDGGGDGGGRRLAGYVREGEDEDDVCLSPIKGDFALPIDKVVSVGTAPGPNNSDHNVNTITNEGSNDDIDLCVKATVVRVLNMVNTAVCWFKDSFWLLCDETLMIGILDEQLLLLKAVYTAREIVLSKAVKVVDIVGKSFNCFVVIDGSEILGF
ncbi:hypothetical protein Tco_1045621 [Tanacetum coccineum]|uniref:Uncharacterized protein n=1 Tax=Tanacetum coccineum TaxID=301880 RepID=A0ABQ5GUH3_9ASTR